MSEAQAFDEITDVVVVGTGAGGMTAAVAARKMGLQVLLLEKEQVTTICAEDELAKGMIRLVLERFGPDAPAGEPAPSGRH